MKGHDDGKLEGSESLLTVQSSVFAFLRENIPSTLKELQWEIENTTVRYEFEPGQSVPNRLSWLVNPPEQQWPDTLLWTDGSNLKHLRS